MLLSTSSGQHEIEAVDEETAVADPKPDVGALPREHEAGDDGEGVLQLIRIDREPNVGGRVRTTQTAIDYGVADIGDPAEGERKRDDARESPFGHPPELHEVDHESAFDLVAPRLCIGTPGDGSEPRSEVHAHVGIDPHGRREGNRHQEIPHFGLVGLQDGACEEAGRNAQRQAFAVVEGRLELEVRGDGLKDHPEEPRHGVGRDL